VSDIATPAGMARQAPGVRLPARTLERGCLWLFAASGCIVFVEPAPFEVMFVLTLVLFTGAGLRLAAALLPLIGLLLLYNLGGAFALVPVADEPRPIWFVAISFYMAVVAVIVAAIVSDDAAARLAAIRNGWVMGGVVAACAGIAGYFDIGGTANIFTLYTRASGTFKDPNVLGTFLVFPTVALLHDCLTGRQRRWIINGVALLILLAGIFLSFSRGAWIVTAGALIMSVGLTFLTTPSAKLRGRLVLLTLAGIGALAMLLVVALQFESIRATFEVRASLNQDYDQGETGRFGNQRRSVPLLLDRPNGMGPLGFREYFPEDPHNTFLNAFASYGWLGGISYAGLIAATLCVGFGAVFRRSRLQQEIIVVWSCLFLLILQGIQIDTDHWRHFYMLLGLTWGLALAARRERASPP
jgi:hypothetical protein